LRLADNFRDDVDEQLTEGYDALDIDEDDSD